jgi:Holliday junction DNA helicase RuvA
MIASLTGNVQSVTSSTLVLEVGGVGYLVHASSQTIAGAKLESQLRLFTTLVVREDAMTLYGFETLQARDFFELLQSVSGIGPKVAQSALAIYQPQELTTAIATEDLASLERIPGLGKKGVARLILELKDKVAGFENSANAIVRSSQQWREQLLLALVGLGFTARDAGARIDLVAGEFEDPSTSALPDLLRAALAAGARA